MKYENKIYISLLWLIMGALLIICRFLNILQSDMWSGIGFGWLACGLMQTAKQLQYMKDEKFREDIDTAINDERNKFLASKAWAWAGYGYVLIACITSVICLILGQVFVSQIISFGICLIIFLYWISYMLLKKRF